MSGYVSQSDILQEGVSCAIATLVAVEGGAMLQNVPDDPHARNMHNHALHLLSMLSDHLHRIQAQVDALDEAAQQAGGSRK